MNIDKKWTVEQRELTSNEERVAADAMGRYGICHAFARLLLLRGYDSVDKIGRLLCFTDTVLHDPFLMKDMDKAANAILGAVGEGRHIAIFGDYDADGVSATSLLYLYLTSLAERMAIPLSLGYYIPSRKGEGYGMSRDALDKLSEKGVELIITVDNGISAASEIAYAYSLGMQVVVTDHHECPPVLPTALAVVDPRREDCTYPFSELSGVGVAFKLITAIEMLYDEKSDRRDIVNRIYMEYSDLAALGTVADVMPLVNENRMIVSYGLGRMTKEPRPGIAALLDRANSKGGKVTSSTVGFGLAPRINAAGRMAQASRAVELFLQNDSEMTERLAEALCEYNKDRQLEEARIIEKVYEQIEETHDFHNDHFIVAEGDDWHSGVIGIVASHVVERYHLPTILITYGDSTEPNAGKFEVGKGSGRGVKGFNLVEALAASSDCLVKFGGHEMAAGLSVTRGNVPELRRRLNDFVRDLPPETWQDEVCADLELAPRDITMELAEQLLLMEPFGSGNAMPLFYMCNAKIVRSYAFGNKKHLKLNFEKDGVQMSGVLFGAECEHFNLSVGEPVDIMFQVDINEYNGTRSVQLIVREMRLAEDFRLEMERASARYDEIAAGVRFSASENILPDREDCKRLYLLLRRLEGLEKHFAPERNLLTILRSECPTMNLTKIRFMYDVMNERGLCRIERGLYNMIEFKILPQSGHVELSDSPVLHRLQSLLDT